MNHAEVLEGKSQPNKFKILAREIEADEDEAAFAAKLRKMRDPKPEGGKDESSANQR